MRITTDNINPKHILNAEIDKNKKFLKHYKKLYIENHNIPNQLSIGDKIICIKPIMNVMNGRLTLELEQNKIYTIKQIDNTLELIRYNFCHHEIIYTLLELPSFLKFNSSRFISLKEQRKQKLDKLNEKY